MKTYTAKEIGQLAQQAAKNLTIIIRASKDVYVNDDALRTARASCLHVIDTCAEQILLRQRDAEERGADIDGAEDDFPF